ncbi:MAG: hypothetical protein ACD_11C00018G0026 [uncultured bacterium]|nr:MAG: hypothetical protein ACD_11C00018G0026 [uncultured bacterium]HBR71552.1 hypothetical protein [Candidatus Moranbacteria bacterium]
MKNKVLHLIQAVDNGGCENMMLRTLPLLSDFEHIIITLHHPGELSEQFKQKNIPIINIGQKNVFDFFSYARLLKEVKRNKPDIIITYLFHADMIGRLFLGIITKNKIIPFLRTTYNHKKYLVARLFEKITKNLVQRYIANSESVKNFYVNNIGVKKENISIINNGIDVKFYEKIRKDENLQKELGIRKGEQIIVCVANLHINKGHQYLLKAFEINYKNNPNIKLLLVGDGKEKINLKKQIDNYSSKNNVLFLGKRNDVPKILKISDIFVLPTLFEGMSNAIMEAMASGLPIATTDIPENREILNEKNSCLFKTSNANDTADKIAFLLSNPELRSILKESSLRTIRNNFDINIIKKKFSNLLDRLIKE